MPLSRSRDYLSIGEVLESLKSDFPDISISKIRFLESEGLISPERTGSGYRKFYEADIARLRYILQLQRDHFMPLKVIRERLASNDGQGEPQAPDAPGVPAGATARDKINSTSEFPTDIQLDRRGLAQASGLDESALGGLEEFGLISDEDGYYDGNDLAVANAAKKLFEHGIEPRHLRMYRQWAEREAGLFQQIVSPLTLRKDSSSHLRASETTRELVDLSLQIRAAVLRNSLRDFL
jgi:DNA-binding transcriptional MerR regulator